MGIKPGVGLQPGLPPWQSTRLHFPVLLEVAKVKLLDVAIVGISSLVTRIPFLLPRAGPLSQGVHGDFSPQGPNLSSSLLPLHWSRSNICVRVGAVTFRQSGAVRAGGVSTIELAKPSRRFASRTETTMSNPHLPSETVDHIIYFLHDSKCALGKCCLVSKSWISRARGHLFADISLRTKNDLELWKGLFPDPLTSPAHYTKTLFVDCTNVVADPEVGVWLRGFSSVVHLKLGSYEVFRPGVSFVPFHGFSPIKSLHVDPFIPPSQLFNLILSFPLLEDLTMTISVRLVGVGGAPSEPQIVPNPSPACTGSLLLSWMAMKPIARWLLSLPGGIHFQKLTLSWSDREEFS